MDTGGSINEPISGYAKNPRVVVAIVNYCTPDLVADCLASLAALRAEWPDFVVGIADNASPDRSAAKIARTIEDMHWGGWAHLLAMPRNGGFGYGNNAVIRKYLESSDPPDYFWLLNSDTVVRPGALRHLIGVMEKQPDAGITGSRLEDPDGTPQFSAFRFHSVSGELESSLELAFASKLLKNRSMAPPVSEMPGTYDWLSGASMLIRTDVLRQIGLFDEDYFLYYEETDLCKRAAQEGWECWYVPESRVVHLVGKSTGVTERAGRPKRRAAYWFDSRRRYFIKHHGRFYATFADLALAFGTALSMLKRRLQRRPSSYPDKFLHDLISHSAAFNELKARDAT